MLSSHEWLIHCKLFELFSETVALKTNRKWSLLICHHHVPSQTWSNCKCNWVCWVGQLVHHWLTHQCKGGLLCRPVKSVPQSVSTCTTDFVVRVNEKLQTGSRLFKNCALFFDTQATGFLSKCFTCKCTGVVALHVMRSHWVPGEGFASGNWVWHHQTWLALCMLLHSNFALLLNIPHRMCTSPVLLHLNLCFADQFLSMLL